MTIQEQYRFIGGRRIPLPGGQELFTGIHPTQSVIVPSETIQAASTCLLPDTLAGHANRLRQLCSGTPLQDREWLPLLESAIVSKILTSDSDIRMVLPQTDGIMSPHQQITEVGVPTRGRPEMLERLLNQLKSNIGEREIVVSVMDSSEDHAGQQATRGICSRFGDSGRMQVRYSSPLSRRIYSRCLAAKASIDPILAEFALAPKMDRGVSTGSSRNAILLEAQGSHVLQLDDDVQCKTTAVPGSDGRYRWGADKNAFGTWFFPDLEGIKEHPFTDQSILSLHEAVLNHTASNNLAMDFVGSMPTALLTRLVKKHCHVVVSSFGVAGDPGTDNPLPFFLGGRKTLERMCASDQAYEEATRERHVIQGSLSPVVSQDIGCMSYCMAVDSRDILPPFCPQQRAAEFVFAAALQRTIPSALFAALPTAILHTPARQRHFDPGAVVTNAAQFGAGELIALLIRQYRTLQLPRGASIADLGRHLSTISQLRREDLQEYLFTCAVPLVEQWVQLLNEIGMTLCEAAPRAKAELERACDRALEMLNKRIPLVPVGDFGGDQECDPLVGFAELIGRFGQLMQEWPAIWEANAELKARGSSLCESPR